MKVNRYEIFLDFDFHNGTYKGNEKISLEGEKVVLDAVDLKINKVKANGKEVEFIQENDKLIIKSEGEINNLEIEFEGKVSEKKLTGIYKASYKDGFIITTQFEATHAREFIPCFDSPNLKAVFKLFVRVDKGLKVISNMPVVSIKEENNKVIY
ncbi:MAG: leucyl aminopeptidase, partial [Saccharolobus sp.]